MEKPKPPMTLIKEGQSRFATAVTDLQWKVDARPGLVVQTTEPGPPKTASFLVYGQPGIGKTTFANTFPNPLFIDIRGGITTIRASKRAYIQPQSRQELLGCLILDNVQAYDTIVLDTATEGLQLFVQAACVVGGRDMPTLAEWSMATEWFRRYIKDLLDLPKYIVVTAQERTDKDETTGKMFAGPDFTPRLMQQLPAWFDCVFHMRIHFDTKTGTKSRRLATVPDGLFPARDRLGGLDEYEVPDFGVIWQKISKRA